jgi:hypothetical protein
MGKFKLSETVLALVGVHQVYVILIAVLIFFGSSYSTDKLVPQKLRTFCARAQFSCHDTLNRTRKEGCVAYLVVNAQQTVPQCRQLQRIVTTAKRTHT